MPTPATKAYKRPTGSFACPKCNRVFDRKDNLQRHLNNQLKHGTDCSKNTTQTTEYTCVHLLDRLLTTLRGPLRIDEHVANNPAHVVPVLQDIWHAVTTVAHVHPARRFELLMQLLELLNGWQLELLYGTVMREHEPPSAEMLHSIRALYQHLGEMQHKGVRELHRKQISNIRRAMALLPSLFGG